jgi:DeoR family transcriptional regulator, suf operon transcriptional repressor
VFEATATNVHGGSRRQVLDVLKRRGEARAEEIAAALGVTVSAARQHLGALQAAGLVDYREVKGTPGRPKHVYRLTEAAQDVFPNQYGELATELLQFVGEEDPELLQRVFEKRRKARLERALERLEGKPFEGKVEELAQILDEEGYLASFEREDDGSYIVQEHNCAIIDVAQLSRMPCAAEIDFLRDALPGASIERVAHMLGGAHLCAYRISKTG